MSVAAKIWARNIPKELQAARNWVAWGPDPDSAKPKCPLILSARDRRASTRKPDTWRDFSLAKAVYERYADEDHGVGFVFTEKLGLVYIDIDDAIDPESAKARDWCREFIRPFIGNAYIEASPSGKGLHIITRAKLPESAGCGGKMNFPEHATSDRVPEVAIFALGKYTTLTGDIWGKQAEIGDGQLAVESVWQAAGIRSVGVDKASGPAPDRAHLPTVQPNRIPREAKAELSNCSAADAPDRSSARFRLYAALARKLEPEEIFGLVLDSDWYVASGASEKGEHATWSDICRVYAKVQQEVLQFEAFGEREKDREEAEGQGWRDLGIPVIQRVGKDGATTEAVYGIAAMARYLTRHPEWKGRIRRDTFSQMVRLDGSPMGESISDLAEQIRVYMRWEREPGVDLLRAAIAEAADAQGYNPVADWLNGLRWDGKLRSLDWLVRAGVEDSAVARSVGRKWLIGLVARALDPGCKMDNVLILEGPEGMKKSMLFEAIAGSDLFSDSPMALGRDDLMVMARCWIIELAELSAFKKAESEGIKKFLAARKDSYRPPYGREVKVFPRNFVCVGTTNDQEYLEAGATNRRFWPLCVNYLNVDIIRAEREQLLAEAVAAFKAGETWWYDEAPSGANATPQALRDARAAREIVDPAMGRVKAFCHEHPDADVQVGDLMELLGMDVTRRDLQLRVTSCLKALGWVKGRKRAQGGPPVNYWRRPDRQGEAEVLSIFG